MSQANIASVQSWLACELELRGIDAVIFTRHVLDIFLNSRHTTDLHLAAKEADIFANLPGSKKRKAKQKYNRRANSFTSADEISMKKEMAVKWLLAAADQQSDEVNSDSFIKDLIEDLYQKLTDLHLFPDVKRSSSSDEEPTLNKQRPKSLPDKQREKYQDAFPMLATNNDPNHQSACLDSVWRQKNKAALSLFSEPATFGAKSTEQTDFTADHSGPRSRESKACTTNSKRKKASFSSDSDEPREPAKNKQYHKKANRRPAQHHYARRRQRPYRIDSASPSRRQQGSTTFHKQRRRRRGCNKENEVRVVENRGVNYRRPDGSRARESQRPGGRSFYNNSGITVKNSKALKNHQHRPYCSQAFQVRRYVDDWDSHSFAYDRQHDAVSSAKKETEAACHPKLRSKWFRDPESGFLEFEPMFRRKDESKSSDDVFTDDDPEPTFENWLWCPSPSLWEDVSDLSPGVAASRLETIYRKPAECHAKDLLDDCWESYKAIFTDVAGNRPQDEEAASSADESVKESLEFPIESFLDSIWKEDACSPLDVSDGDDLGDVNNNITSACVETSHREKLEKKCPCMLQTCKICLRSKYECYCAKDVAPLFQYNSFKSGTVNHTYACAAEQCSDEFERLAAWIERQQAPLSSPWAPSSRKAIWLQNLLDVEEPGTGKEDLVSEVGRSCVWDAYFPTGGCDIEKVVDAALAYNEYLFGWSSLIKNSCSSELFVRSYHDLMCDIQQFSNVIPVQDAFSTTPAVGSTPDNDVEEEETDYLSALVQSVLDDPADGDDQFPESHAAESPRAEDDDAPHLHPDDQSPNSLLRLDSRNSDSKQDAFLAECVNENEAWKTSLRIGNMWQAISGIRPVDVVYSEKNTSTRSPVLQPTSLTHFRPIHASEAQDSGTATSHSNSYQDSCDAVEYQPPISDDFIEFKSFSPAKRSNAESSTDAYLQSIEMEIKRLLFDTPTCAGDSYRSQPFRPKFRKLGEDKGQQTTFEQQIQQIDSDLQKELTARPPKANSR